LRELLDAKRSRKSEQLSADQLALFAAAWQARQVEPETPAKPDGSDDDDSNAAPGGGESVAKRRTGGRQPLPRHLKRERIVHDLAEEERHCADCHQVIEDVCKKYACACTVKTATKPPQPMCSTKSFRSRAPAVSGRTAGTRITRWRLRRLL
jgi:transposase IS166 family protein